MSRPNAAIAERLMAEGRISSDQLEGVLHNMQRYNTRVEDALIETNAVPEQELLKYIARMLSTRFVTTEKLARADIDPVTLGLVPRKTAETMQVFPVAYDAAKSELSVVAANPGDPDVSKAIAGVSKVREIKIYVGRPAAVKAAIAKYYGGNIHAFAQVDRSQIEQYRSMMDVYERKLISEESLTHSLSTRERKVERNLSVREMERGEKASAVASSKPGVATPAGSVASEDFAEALTVLVSLLENGRGELRGHSALVARLVRKIAERIGMSAYEINGFVVAALLHDIGKSSAYHLTALNVSEYEGHRLAAQKSHTAPLRLFESVQLGQSAESALRSMYERFDGQGFPDGTSAKDVPLGARLISIAETYADLTQNSRNPFRKKLSPTEACDVLARYRGTVFDPNLVDLFKHTVLGEDVRARLLADRPTVLLVDADPEESTVLELRLLESGYDVQVARSPESAVPSLQSNHVDLVICDTEFPGATGFALLERARSMGQKLPPWVFVTRDGRRESVSRAFELGAADYVIKPVPGDVLVAKIRRLIEGATSTRAARGVNGSLAEMTMPDIVQVLAQSRKSGQLKIRSGNDVGEIHFDAGLIVNAMWGKLRGEEAFYAMCGLAEGDFALDPSFKPTARVIQASADALLLEGMRRMDEGTR